MSAKQVVVIGAGVVGLTTALMIQEKGGYDVTIIAETFPSDFKTIKYTSFWAGAYQVFYRGKDARELRMAKETFQTMWELSAPGGAGEGCFRRITAVEYYPTEIKVDVDWMPDLKEIPKDELPPGSKSGFTVSTYTIDPFVYVNYLLARFLARGGTIVRGAVQHINQITESGPQMFANRDAKPVEIDALVVCTGLGTRTLGGIADADVHAIRGQTVIIHAPWITKAVRASREGAVDTYVIPRRNGNVVLGAIRDPNDWYPVPRPETNEDILQRTLALCPEIAPPEVRAKRAPTVDDVRPLIVEIGCGLRPGRDAGIRLETIWVDAGKNRKIPMVTNYGHGGGGFERSWGSASIALELLEKTLSPQQRSCEVV